MPINRRLEYNLEFNADTNLAQQRIKELQISLNNLSSNAIKNNAGTKMSEGLQQSITSARELQSILQKAINPKTGNLDLSKFSDELKSSGKDLAKYRDDLNNIGPQGSKAFLQLAQSVATAEVPLTRTSQTLEKFKTTIANAARWQISSSVIHAFVGAIEGAYGYAQDLNKSLTDIAIVTGRSVDEMAQFGAEANKAAQNLSASTLDYTNSALIYYQQGRLHFIHG